MSVGARWTAFLDADEVGTSLALVRMGVSSAVLRTLLAMLPGGAAWAVWSDAAHGGWREHLDTDWRIALLGGWSPEVTQGLFVASMLGAALMFLGVGGPWLARGIALLTLQAFTALTGLNAHAGGSYDALMTNALWLLVLAGPSRTLSVECLRTTGAWTSARTVKRWPRFLVVFQAVVMYTTTGWQKLSDHWVPGGDLGALWYIQQQPTWALYDLSWVAPLFPLTQLATLTTWLWEVTAPIGLVAWWATLDPAGPGRVRALVLRLRVREVFLALGVFFHAMIAVTMEVGPFSWASLALYPAFLHPHEWRGWLASRR